ALHPPCHFSHTARSFIRDSAQHPHEGASFQAPARQHRPRNHGSGVAPGAIAGDVSPRRAQATTAAKAWERTAGLATPDSDWKPGGLHSLTFFIANRSGFE